MFLSGLFLPCCLASQRILLSLYILELLFCIMKHDAAGCIMLQGLIFASHRGDLRNNRFLPYLCMLFYFSARSKSEDDSLDAYTPSRRDTVSRKDNTLKRDISNASQLSSGNIEIFPCFMISFFSI